MSLWVPSVPLAKSNGVHLCVNWFQLSESTFYCWEIGDDLWESALVMFYKSA